MSLQTATARRRISTSAAASPLISMKWRRARALAVTKILVSVALGRTLRAASRAFLRLKVSVVNVFEFFSKPVGERDKRLDWLAPRKARAGAARGLTR